MKINSGSPGAVRPDAAREVRPTAGDSANKSNSIAEGIARQDRVEISEAGRAKAAEAVNAPVAAGPNRLQDIRQRVLQGAYDTDSVVAQVANRILDRGDI